MAQRPREFMHCSVKTFDHEQAMDDLSKQIRILRLLNHAQYQRIRMEHKTIMLSMMRNRLPSRYLIPPYFGPVWHDNMGIGPYLPFWLPESKGTGAFIPEYNRGPYRHTGGVQHKPQTKQARAGGKKEKKDTVSGHTSPELLLPKEWTY